MTFKEFLYEARQWYTEFTSWSSDAQGMGLKVMKTSKDKWECFNGNRTVGEFNTKRHSGFIEV